MGTYKDPDYKKKHYEANKEKYKAKAAKWQAENPEKVKEYNRKRYIKHKERIAARHKAYYESLPVEVTRKRAKNWRDKNPGKAAAMCAKRRAKIKQCSFSSIPDHEIAAFYEMAARVSKCLGIPHDVDHYYPLQGETCCGLHIPSNLRVIPASLNRSKNNKLPEEYHALQ